MAVPKYAIPQDWIEEDGHLVVLFSLPNSRDWRTLVEALIHSLSYGRFWDEKTGNIKQVQEIGLDIWESMLMPELVVFEDMRDHLGRMADALEAANDDGKVSLDDVIEGIVGDETYDKIRPLLMAARTMLSWIPDVQIDPMDALMLITQAIGVYNQNRHAIEQIHLRQLDLILEHDPPAALFLDTIIPLLPGGDLADSLLETDEYVIGVIQIIIGLITGTSTNERLEDIAEAIEALGNESPQADQLREMLKAALIKTEGETETPYLDLISQIDPQDELTAISQAIADIPDTQDELTAIADRLAPEGEAIQPTLDEQLEPLGYLSALPIIANMIKHCCKTREVSVPTVETIVPCDPEKCQHAAIIVGQVYADFDNVRSEVLSILDIGDGFLPDTMEWIINKARLIALVYSSYLHQVMAWVDGRFELFLESFAGIVLTDREAAWMASLETIKPDMVCAIHNADTATEARQDIDDLVIGLGLADDEEQAALLFVEGLYVEAAFGEQWAFDWLSVDYFAYYADKGDWYIGDCSECGCGEHPLPCADQTGRIVPSDGQYDAEYTGSQWEVDILLVGPYSVEGTIARQSQVVAHIYDYKCDEQICTSQEIGNLYDDIPLSRGSHVVISCSVEFSATLTFIALDNEDCGT